MWTIVVKILFGDSWRTSLAGYVMAVCALVLPVLYTGRMPTLPEFSAMLITALVAAIQGRVQKDHNVTGTGGTRPTNDGFPSHRPD